MLKMFRNESNFKAYPTTMMNSGVIYNLSQFNDANRTGILTDSGILLMDTNSVLLFVCLDDNVTYTIGTLALYF